MSNYSIKTVLPMSPQEEELNALRAELASLKKEKESSQQQKTTTAPNLPPIKLKPARSYDFQGATSATAEVLVSNQFLAFRQEAKRKELAAIQEAATEELKLVRKWHTGETTSKVKQLIDKVQKDMKPMLEEIQVSLIVLPVQDESKSTVVEQCTNVATVGSEQFIGMFRSLFNKRVNRNKPLPPSLSHPNPTQLPPMPSSASAPTPTSFSSAQDPLVLYYDPEGSRMMTAGGGEDDADAVRGIIVLKSMAMLASAMDEIATFAQEGVISIAHVDEQSRSNNSTPAFATSVHHENTFDNVTVHFYFTEDDTKHVCELQIVHEPLFTKRTGMSPNSTPGHVFCGNVRNPSVHLLVQFALEFTYLESVKRKRGSG
jgi:hypothetical protein